MFVMHMRIAITRRKNVIVWMFKVFTGLYTCWTRSSVECMHAYYAICKLVVQGHYSSIVSE